jgi:hypothetical protein
MEDKNLKEVCNVVCMYVQPKACRQGFDFNLFILMVEKNTAPD